MAPDVVRGRGLLAAFDFKSLFIEELGWNRHGARLEVFVDGKTFLLSAVSEKCGMVVFECNPAIDGQIPDHASRRKIERQVTKSAYEHLIIYLDGGKATQVWQWVRREHGKPASCREHTYRIGQPGDSLIQKLRELAVSLEEEECLTLPDVTGRAKRAFDIERVTKKFYDRFKTEHAAFLHFLEGIPDEEMERWYVSVMLNRLMFIYFIQKKGFLNNDTDYLKNKLSQCRKEIGKDRYYRDFLCPLFFEGFAKRKEERSEKSRKLLGEVPYLNGGIFNPHQIEQLHGKTITIPDKAFEKLFEFFDAYHWHLDERPLKRDDEINPDVLGYIFEKYVNQKQMGAYYTKEDITEYISKNTVIPFLFDAAKEKCKVAFEGDRSVWQLLQEDPDRYIYPAVSHGIIWDARQNPPKRLGARYELPLEIAEGLDTGKEGLLERRKGWNKPAPEECALPTEIWREVVARRKRYEEVREKLASGEVKTINDLITYNLDIRQFAQDVIENSEGPELLSAFWRVIGDVTVLDPTCGSGAFLFAALNILESLYEACLERMRFFLEEWGENGRKNHPNYHKIFTGVLKRVEDHPNYRYFIFKSIIVNNLYGVDIMEEAVEICKLRLFLKLVAQIERVEEIEPLPDIDFNIRAGNTLVGFTSLKEVKHAATLEDSGQGKLLFGETEKFLRRIEEDAAVVDQAFRLFQEMQTAQGMSPSDFSEAKENLRTRLRKLTDELDRFLASEYGVSEKKIPNSKKYRESFEKWRISHQPFHWFAEFYGILKAGGFDVIIGNPPYVEYKNTRSIYQIHGFATEDCGDLYAFVMERSDLLLTGGGCMGMIVPVSITSTDGFDSLRRCLGKYGHVSWCIGFAERPSKLFTGVEKRLTIWLMSHKLSNESLFLSNYRRWFSEERDTLFSSLSFVGKSDLGNLVGSSIPKVARPSEIRILDKLSKQTRLQSFYLNHSSNIVYYTRKVRYFVQFFDFIPEITDAKGHHLEPSELKTLYLATPQQRDAIIAVLNSGLFFWFFCAYSDVRNVNRREIEAFPCSIDKMDNQVSKKLQLLAKVLMEDFKKKSKVLTNDYGKHGQLSIQTFQPRLSKPIIDEIDRILGKHYGFTNEELDFIINYDIKYRMGQEGAEDSEE